MDPTAFVARMRDHYVEQFAAFADDQRRGCTQGASEVKLQLSETSEVFQRLYCVDFIKNDGGSEVVELQPAHVLSFDPIEGSINAASLSIEHLRCDDVVIYHDLATVPSGDLADWFRRWFDPDDGRHDEHEPLSNVIHSLLVQPNVLSIDFGTAPPEAFWEILDLLAEAGAHAIRVSSSRAEATAA